MAKADHRKPKLGASVSLKKQPKAEFDPDAYHTRRPVWRIGLLCMSEPAGCGWHLVDGAKLLEVHRKLAELEKLTWREILVTQKYRNHHISVDAICQSARKSLAAAGFKDVDEVTSLRLSATERVFGVMDNEVFQVLWWDPDHEVCPAPKRHT